MWGDEDASEEEVIKASEAAQAAAFLQTFPDGWQTSWDRAESTYRADRNSVSVSQGRS